jgi:hypothetical protein
MKRKITPAKKVCPYPCCPHNVLFQVFNTDAEPVVTKWVEENGACMLEITTEEEAAGVAGMRRGATLVEIAETYQVRLNAVQEAIARALKKARKIIEGDENLLSLNDIFG